MLGNARTYAPSFVASFALVYGGCGATYRPPAPVYSNADEAARVAFEAEALRGQLVGPAGCTQPLVLTRTRSNAVLDSEPAIYESTWVVAACGRTTTIRVACSDRAPVCRLDAPNG